MDSIKIVVIRNKKETLEKYSEEIIVPESTTVKDIIDQLDSSDCGVIRVNSKWQKQTYELKSGDVLRLFPPLLGG